MSTGKSLNILFDSWSTQVMYQQAPPNLPKGAAGHPIPTGNRLNTLLGAIKSIGQTSGQMWNVSFTTPPITPAQLEGIDIYISLTRYLDPAFAYLPSELEALKEWVAKGGNILLLTNHGGPARRVNENWTRNDAPLAAQFGVRLEPFFVSGPEYLMTMSVLHDIPGIANKAPVIAAHDSCIIFPPDRFAEIAKFPAGSMAFDDKTKKTVEPPSPYFAIQVHDVTNKQAGKFIVIGNSGWIGDYGTPNPAPGCATLNHNLLFMLNCIGHLGGIDMPGF